MKKKPSVLPEEIKASFRQEYDGTIRLVQADEAYLLIRGLSPKALGKDIRELYSAEEFRRLTYYLGSYQGDSFRVQYVQELEDRQWWTVKASIQFPELYCTARPLQRWESMLEWNETEIGPAGFVMVEQRENQTVIVENNEPFLKIFPEWEKTDVLEAAEQNRLGSTFRKTLRKCLQKDRCQEFCDIRPDTNEWLHWRMVSFEMSGKRRVCLTVQVLPGGTPVHRHRPYTPTEELFDHHFAAIGTLQKLEEEEHYCFYDVNPCLGELLQKKAISREAILHAPAFRSAVGQGIVSYGLLRYDAGASEEITYLMCAMPVISSSGTQYVMVCLLSVEGPAIMDYERFRNLTMREGNVVRLALKGMDNRDIGRALQISEGTVKRELFSCYRKLKINSKLELFLSLFGFQ